MTFDMSIIDTSIAGPNVPTLELTHGYSTIVDDDDFERLRDWRWIVRRPRYKTRTYAYAMCCRNGKVIHMHRLSAGANEGELVDHINGDTLDNRKCNLRICTHKQNRRNEGLSSDNTSGFKGVTKAGNRWRAQICVDYQMKYLGQYATREEAAKVYDTAAREHHGEFARLNFPT